MKYNIHSFDWGFTYCIAIIWSLQKILSLLIVIHLLADLICIVLLLFFLSFSFVVLFLGYIVHFNLCALHAFVLYILQNWVNGPAKSQVIPQYRKDWISPIYISILFLVKVLNFVISFLTYTLFLFFLYYFPYSSNCYILPR